MLFLDEPTLRSGRALKALGRLKPVFFDTLDYLVRNQLNSCEWCFLLLFSMINKEDTRGHHEFDQQWK